MTKNRITTAIPFDIAPKFTVNTTTMPFMISADQTTSPSFVLFDNHRHKVVEIFANGEIVFGENYTPSSAAKTFWQAMRWYGNRDTREEL